MGGEPLTDVWPAAQVHSTERQAQDLILDLRELPSKGALALRAQVRNSSNRLDRLLLR